jgi:hypothetical protein
MNLAAQRRGSKPSRGIVKGENPVTNGVDQIIQHEKQFIVGAHGIWTSDHGQISDTPKRVFVWNTAVKAPSR